MWSGPRNISTAMMRAWENRPDTFVMDEPFYAFYLQKTDVNHPGAEEVMAEGETDWRKVIAQLTGQVPNGARIFYQKQMTHHLLPEISRDWLREMTNCFLIRNPAEVIASYIKKNPDPTLGDLGFVQQADIFEFVRREIGSIPPVLDAADVLRNAERMLRLLCDAVAVEFKEAMLSWPPGRRETDGLWAKYWYAEVERSTSFQPYRERKVEVPENLQAVHARCIDFVKRLVSRATRGIAMYYLEAAL
jgi:hypothetical protein